MFVSASQLLGQLLGLILLPHTWQPCVHVRLHNALISKKQLHNYSCIIDASLHKVVSGYNALRKLIFISIHRLNIVPGMLISWLCTQCAIINTHCCSCYVYVLSTLLEHSAKQQVGKRNCNCKAFWRVLGKTCSQAFLPPVFDHFQLCKYEEKGSKDLITCSDSR